MNTSKELYLYITTQTSEDIYPNNEATYFRAKLPQILKLEGTWHIALLDIDLPKLKDDYKPDFLVVSCSTCEPNYYYGPYYNYFGEVKSGRALRFDSPRYVRVNSRYANTIKFRIRDNRDEIPSVKQGQVICILHLRQETPQGGEFFFKCSKKCSSAPPAPKSTPALHLLQICSGLPTASKNAPVSHLL